MLKNPKQSINRETPISLGPSLWTVGGNQKNQLNMQTESEFSLWPQTQRMIWAMGTEPGPNGSVCNSVLRPGEFCAMFWSVKAELFRNAWAGAGLL